VFVAACRTTATTCANTTVFANALKLLDYFEKN
jgi:hypothetical protein